MPPSDEDLGLGKRRRFYTPAEVALHNCGTDCWVSIFDKVFDITELIAENKGPLVLPLVKFAGKSLSEWFDEDTCDVKRVLDPITNLVLPFLPHGRFVHIAPPEPVSTWRTDFETPWWRDDERFCIGSLSQRTMDVRLVNMLTQQETLLEVCTEESLKEIQDRYCDWNAHSASYTWKVLDEGSFRPLDMDLTLAENGVVDETDEFERLSIAPDTYIPALHLYYKDDLTVA